MTVQPDTRRILIFLLFAFGIAWATGLAIYLTGGLQDSPPLIPGGPPITLALILLAGPYMFAPALAHILTRLITREGWGDTWLRPHLRRGWRYWLAAWLLPPLWTILGGALFFLIFPQHFDPTMQAYIEAAQAQAAQTGQTVPTEFLRLSALIGVASALVISPLINSLFTFGEEFGWRAYLQPKLMPLGGRAALILMGMIWGVWHWPVIFMGYEYGFDYPGAPFAGPLLFVWIAFLMGTFLGWAALRGGSVWPAVVGHATINGFAGSAILFTRGEPNPLLGPLPVGAIAALPLALLALAIFFHPRALTPAEPPPLVGAG